MSKQFPIQDGPSVPWSYMAPHESMAKKNHGQTLKRLAERGGLGAGEAECLVTGQPLSLRNGEHDWDDLRRRWYERAEKVNNPPESRRDFRRARLAVDTIEGYGFLREGQDGWAGLHVLRQFISDVEATTFVRRDLDDASPAIPVLLATIDLAVIRRVIGSRSAIADARLDVGEPYERDEIVKLLGDVDFTPVSSGY